jgi:hypothetical protein
MAWKGSFRPTQTKQTFGLHLDHAVFETGITSHHNWRFAPLARRNLRRRNSEVRDSFVSILVIARRTLAKTRFSQPSFRNLVRKPIKARRRDEHRITTARGHLGDEIPAALDAVSLQHRLTGPKFETPWLR